MAHTLTKLKELDYSDPANRAVLRRAVAEAQGYAFMPEPEEEGSDAFVILRPDGSTMIWSFVVFDEDDPEDMEILENRSWETGLDETQRKTWTDNKEPGIPEYPDDLNAAMPLLDEIGEWVDIHWMKLKDGLVYWVGVALWGEAAKKKRCNVHIEHADLCIACCLAYLEWKEAQVKA